MNYECFNLFYNSFPITNYFNLFFDVMMALLSIFSSSVASLVKLIIHNSSLSHVRSIKQVYKAAGNN